MCKLASRGVASAPVAGAGSDDADPGSVPEGDLDTAGRRVVATLTQEAVSAHQESAKCTTVFEIVPHPRYPGDCA